MIGETHVPKFFVEPGEISEKQVVITGKDVNHIKNVLRMKVGERSRSVTASMAENTDAAFCR